MSIEERNFRNLVWDVAWFGVSWVTISRFLSVYAIRLGAGPEVVGWLTAGPAIAMVLSSFVSVRWRRRFSDSVKAIFWPTLGFRMVPLLLAMTPFLPAPWQPLWLVFSVTAPGLMQGISDIMFLSLLRETMTDDRMPALLGRRGVALNTTLVVCALAFGIWLEWAPFPFNYQVMFLVAFFGLLMSMWHVMKVKPIAPVEAPKTPQPHARPWGEKRFQHVMVLAGAVYGSFVGLVPIITLRLVDDMGATEGFMAAFGMVELTAAGAVAAIFTRLVARFGIRNVLGLGAVSSALAAATVAFAPTLAPTLVAGALTGIGFTLMDMGMIGYVSENTPVGDAAPYMRTFLQVAWIAVFIGPILTTQLMASGIPTVSVLLGGAVIRLLVAALAIQAPARRLALSR